MSDDVVVEHPADASHGEIVDVLLVKMLPHVLDSSPGLDVRIVKVVANHEACKETGGFP